MKFRSLKTKMTLAVTLMVILSLSGMAYLALSHFEKSFVQATARQQFTLVTSLAEEIDLKIGLAQQEVIGIAHSLPEEILHDPESLQKFMEETHESEPLFDSALGVLSPAGIMLAVSPMESGMVGRDLSFRPYFRETVASGLPQISSPFVTAQEHGHPIVVFTAPVFNRQGELSAVVVGAVDLLKDNFFGRISDIRLGNAGYLYVFSTDRTIIVHPDRSRILKTDVPPGANRLFDRAAQGFEGTGETVTSRGLHTFSSFKRLKTRDWILAANSPISEVFAPMAEARTYILVTLAAATLLSLLLTWLLMRHLTAPLLVFISRVKKMASEEVERAPIRLRSRDEIGTLAEVFNLLIEETDNRKRALEDNLFFSENLLQNSPVAGFVLNREHRVISWNRACEELTGVKAADMLGTANHPRAFYGHDRPCLADLVLEGAVSKKSLFPSLQPWHLNPEGLQAEGWFPDLNGIMRYLVFVAAPVRGLEGEIVAAVETLQDLTDRRIAEESLKRSRDHYLTILEEFPAFIWRSGLDAKCDYFNKTWLTFTGRTLRQECGDGWAEGVHPDDLERCLSTYLEHFERRIPFSMEYRLRRHDGEYRWIIDMGRPFEDLEGNFAGYIGACLDITEQRKLQESEYRRRVMGEAATEALRTFLDTGSPEAMARNLVCSCADIVGAGAAFLAEKSGEKLRLLAGGGPAFSPLLKEGLEERIGALLPEEGRGGWDLEAEKGLVVPLRIAEEELGVVGLLEKEDGFSDGDREDMENIARTIALVLQIVRAEQAREEAADHLRKVQKFEAIGQLAGGVAHDFNNLLTVINGYGSLLVRSLDHDSRQKHDAEIILEAGRKAENLVRQMLAFSRKQVMTPVLLNVNELICNFRKLLLRMVREDIEVRWSLAPDLGRVKADPAQVEQILINLVVNARDALPKGGRITVRTANIDLDEHFARLNPGAATGSAVMFCVEDTGTGMNPEVRERVFEPFFTTKEPGRGTGLGLSTVYGIVKQSGGYVTVASEPGEGTIFSIFLPRMEEEAAPPPPRRETASTAGGGTVLLVEDEAEVLGLTAKILEGNGFTVLGAGRPEEAIRLFRENPAVDLVLTDMVLPGMSGVELCRRLRKKRTNLKILFMSGYGDFHGQHLTDDEGGGFLQKPFSPEDLVRKVSEAIRSPHPAARG